MQRRGTIDAALERLVDRPLRELDPPVLAGLRLGMYELLFADGTPDHAAVDQAVELVKRAGAPHASGFVNAVLRRAGREREALVESLLRDDSTPETAAVAHSAPLWLAQMWWRELGPEDARSLLAACNEPPETAFRVNTLRTDRESRARPPPRRRRRCFRCALCAAWSTKAHRKRVAAGAGGDDRGRGADRATSFRS